MTTKTNLLNLLSDTKVRTIGKFTDDDEFNINHNSVFPVAIKDDKPTLHFVKNKEMESILLLLDGLGELGGGSPQCQLAQILSFGNIYGPEEIREHILNLDKVMIRMGHIPQ